MTNIPNVVDPKPISATIESLAWMAGGWYGTVNGDPVDEHWSTPAGGGDDGHVPLVEKRQSVPV